MRLSELFPAEDYQFHLTLHREDPVRFFRDRDMTGGERAERRKWVAEAPARYTALTPPGEPVFAEFRERAPAWGLDSGLADVRELAAACEPDVLLLARGDDGSFRLCGGALVFPSGWALETKLGGTLADLHAIVPGLNDALGPAIDRFLERLRPGAPYGRWNWGLAAHDERNAHPARALPAPRPPVALDRLWLRLEHQLLLALPRSRGIAFGIRIVLHRLDEAVAEPGVAAGLARALETMPSALQEYKRIRAIAAELAGRLRSLASRPDY